MILDEAAYRWQHRVTAEALRLGWNAYPQELHNQRQRDPSVILIRPRRVILAYLRTKRPRKRPPVERYAGIAGVEVYVWTPADWPTVRAALITSRPLDSTSDPQVPRTMIPVS